MSKCAQCRKPLVAKKPWTWCYQHNSYQRVCPACSLRASVEWPVTTSRKDAVEVVRRLT